MAVKFWTKDEIQQLKTLWAEGRTAKEIAAIIGRPRNGIIGQAHRLGLEKRENPVGKRSRIVEIKKDKSEVYAGNGFNFGRAKRKHHMTVKKEERKARIAEIDGSLYGGGKKLQDLEHKECRWPVGDSQTGDLLFCGAPIHRKSYCEKHDSIAYKNNVGSGE